MADRHPADVFKMAEFAAELGTPLEPWQSIALLDVYSFAAADPTPPDAGTPDA